MIVKLRKSALVGAASAIAIAILASGFARAQDGVDQLPPIDAFPPIDAQDLPPVPTEELPPPSPPQELPLPGQEPMPAQAEPDWLNPDVQGEPLPPPEQPAEALPQPRSKPNKAVEEIVAEQEKKVERVTNPVAEFAGLDKITGRITSFDVYINETVQFGALQVTPKVCYSRPDAEEPKTDSFVEVDEITLDRKIRRIFTGWMFAESPGISAVEHAVYDVWLKACKQKSNVPPPEQAKSN